jgi:hypothetical protein
MILQTPTPPSPFPGIALILAVWGAVVDWRYKRKGGKKPSKRDRLLFLIALALVVVLFIVLALIGVRDVAGMIGAATVDFGIVLFATWELGRWRVRRKYPLPTKVNAPAQLNTPLQCSKCGQDSDPSAKFCPNCGNTLAGQSV